MSSHSNSRIGEGEKILKLARSELVEAGASGAAVAKAYEDGGVALVHTLWEVECILWDGREHTGYASVEDEGIKICRDKFGWVVRKRHGWTYKYSKCFGETAEVRDMQQWITPKNPVPATWSLSEDTGSMEKWDVCTVQKGLYFAIVARLNSIPGVNGAIDMKTPLRQDDANNLLEFVKAGDKTISGDFKKWVEDSAR